MASESREKSLARPARMGKPWEEAEVAKLLAATQKKMPIAAIAAEHERTIGAIISFRRKLAGDYHFNEKKSLEEIVGLTGLSKDEVEDAIKMREIRIKTDAQIKSCAEENKIEGVAKQAKERRAKPSKGEPTMAEVVAILKDIQSKLSTLLEKVA